MEATLLPPTKSYGTVAYSEALKCFRVISQPHVRGKIKRYMPGARQQGDGLVVSLTDSNCADLKMLFTRFPHYDGNNGALSLIESRVADFEARLLACDEVLSNGHHKTPIPTVLPLRSYQHAAVALLMHRNRLLVGDDLGLGKTSIALGAIAAGATPAIIVCQNHLVSQWQDEALKFLGLKFRTHIIKSGKLVPLPPHEILIIPYSLIGKWADSLAMGYGFVCFDESQELRRDETAKYNAAYTLAQACSRALGLTATPIYNYGDEIYNILDLLLPDCLGPRNEFLTEWCRPAGSGHYSVKEPVELGTFLTEQHLFLRRRRAEVGRELPEINRIVHDVEFSAELLSRINSQVAQLAHAILSSKSSFTERGQAARQLDLLLRQKTGISKAPSVAAFVADLVRSGENVVLCGWHREVYSIWENVFREEKIPCWLYTGTENSSEKVDAVRNYLSSPEPGVLVLSLRSGAGLNGLQTKSSIIVFGELDWSPQVHDQCVGRLRRDGQSDRVTAVYMVASGGSDPIVAHLLGLKREQSEGIINPETASASDPLGQQSEEGHGTALARQILANLKQKP